VAGDQHDLRGLAVLDVPEQLHPAAVGELQVDQHHVGLLARELDARFHEAACDGRRESRDAHELIERGTGIQVVLDDEGVGHGFFRSPL
jgi:hypothetical protein